MEILRHLQKTTLAISLLIGICFNIQAQSADEGSKLFNANCTSCHAIQTKVIGPALKGVHKKYDEAWLIKWVRNSQELVKAGDAKAVKVYEENNKVPMTSFTNLTDVQIKSLIAYIKAESEKAPVATAGTSVTAGSETDIEANGSLANRINWMLVVVFFLMVIVLSVVVKILETLGKIKGKEILNLFTVNGILLLAFLVVGMIATVWEFMVHGPLTVNAQTPASEHGVIYESMFMITLVLTGIVFVITQILLFWFGFRYRYSKDRKALFYPDNHKLEFIWTIIPAVVLTVLVVRGLQTWSSITDRKQAEKAQVIEVFGFQFAWNVRYAGADNKLGPHDFRKMGVVNALGVDPSNETAKDDIVATELHLKVGQPVVLKFRAKDVIHSAFLPHFRVQMNVVPGLPTQFTFTPTVTTAEMRNKMNNQKFDYILLCNKICGSAHYRMKMKVVIDSQEEYYKWLSGQSKLVAISTPAANTETKALATK